MMHAYSTDREWINPFGSTVDDPRELRQRAGVAIAHARKRLAAVPQPRSYWEEPGLHGSGRQVSLRRPAMQSAVKRRTERSYSTDKLPARPSARLPIGSIVLVGGAVLGAAALVWWLHKRRRQTTQPHIGEDICGFDLLGVH